MGRSKRASASHGGAQGAAASAPSMATGTQFSTAGHIDTGKRRASRNGAVVFAIVVFARRVRSGAGRDTGRCSAASAWVRSWRRPSWDGWPRHPCTSCWSGRRPWCCAWASSTAWRGRASCSPGPSWSSTRCGWTSACRPRTSVPRRRSRATLCPSTWTPSCSGWCGARRALPWRWRTMRRPCRGSRRRPCARPSAGPRWRRWPRAATNWTRS